jgi:hypothetical protein
VLYGYGFSWRYDGNYKEVQIQAAVIMPNKKKKKLKEEQKRTDQIESTQ